MLSARNVTYSIDNKMLVENISLDFKAGDFNVIMGQNGAGKSTLLKILAGNIKHIAGEVLLLGRNLNSYSDLQLARIRAVLSQHYDIAFPITSQEITMMGRYPHFKNIPDVTDNRICEKAMSLMGVTELRERYYNTLSGGEAQKVQMARVMAQIWQNENDGESNKILFLDEPISNLDLHYQHHILKNAKQFTKNNSLVIAVLHDINLALNYADRIIFMKNGKLTKTFQSPEDIKKEDVSLTFDVNVEMIKNPLSNKPIFIVTE